MSLKKIKRVFRCENTGSVLRFDSSDNRYDAMSKGYQGASCDNKGYNGISSNEHSQKTITGADVEHKRMITRQSIKPADKIPEGMSAAEYARIKMIWRMQTPPNER